MRRKTPKPEKKQKTNDDELDVARMRRILDGIDGAEAPSDDNLPDFPPPRETSFPELTGESLSALNAQRKTRAMEEAKRVGSGLFNRAPEFLQKEVLHLIMIIDSLSHGHPKMRNKLIWQIVTGILEAARIWLGVQAKQKKDEKKGDA